jgi:FAD/FMN-containing dehydrogenase
MPAAERIRGSIFELPSEANGAYGPPMTFTTDTTALGRTFRGQLHTPGSAGYDEARSIWNAQIDRRPALVATCSDAGDVAAVVRYAVRDDLLLSVKAGGHHVAGSAIAEGGVVVDLSALTAVRLDEAQARVHVQGGAKLGDLDRGTLPFGYLTPAGIDHDTGVGGLTLGGGVGWSMRRHGLTCDNLQAVTMVNAAGEIVRANDGTDPDLMWGLRGGGGNFGIVTEFEFAAHRIRPAVLAGFAVYHGRDTIDVLRTYRSIVGDAPDDLTTIVFLRTAPPVPWMPAEAAGKPILMIGLVWLGDLEAGERVVAPLRKLATPIVETIAPKPMIEHQAVLEGANPVGHRYYWKSAPLGNLSDEVIGLLDEHLHTISSPHSLLGFFQLGGAVARNGALGAFPNRDARFLVNYAVHWIEPDEDDVHRAWTRNAMAQIEPHALGGGYVNFLADHGTDAVRAAYGEDRFNRLVKLKNRFDPYNVFRHNQNIAPSDTTS